MNSRTQSILIISGTLVIGMVLGALLWSNIASQRLAEIRGLRSPERMVRFIEEGIEPTDEAQRQQIRGIVEEAASQLSEQARTSYTTMREVMDDMHEQLDPILTDAQKNRLQEHLGRARARMQRDRNGERSRSWRKRGNGERPRRGFRGFGWPDSLRGVPDSLLSDEQKIQIRERLEHMKTQINRDLERLAPDQTEEPSQE